MIDPTVRTDTTHVVHERSPHAALAASHALDRVDRGWLSELVPTGVAESLGQSRHASRLVSRLLDGYSNLVDQAVSQTKSLGDWLGGGRASQQVLAVTLGGYGCGQWIRQAVTREAVQHLAGVLGEPCYRQIVQGQGLPVDGLHLSDFSGALRTHACQPYFMGVGASLLEATLAADDRTARTQLRLAMSPGAWHDRPANIQTEPDLLQHVIEQLTRTDHETT